MKFTEGSPIPAIIGVGEALPPRRITNSDIDTFLGKKNGYTDRVMRGSGAGINERYWVEEGNSAVSTLAVRALDEALEMSGLERGDINALWLGTSSGDKLSVSTPAIIQDKMGLPNNLFGSTNQDACPGWVIAAHRAATSLTSPLGIGGYHAVIGAEVISPYLDPQDPRTSILFGDAAGATIFANVKPDKGMEAVMAFTSGLDGKYAKSLGIEAGSSELPPSEQALRERRQYLKMEGDVIAGQAGIRMPQAVRDVLAQDDFPIEEIDKFVFHQANRRIVEAAAESLGIPLEKCIFTVHEMGNTSAASIPTAINRGVRRGEIRRNNIIVVASFGAGLVYSAAILPMVGLPKTTR